MKVVPFLLIVGSAVGVATHASQDQTQQDALQVVSAISPVTVTPELAASTSQVLSSAIGNRRIVLLGENGHGVAPFTLAKVEIVKYLHERLGFDVVAFESGFYECRGIDERLGQEPIAQLMRMCLLAQFHHRELMPLFEYAAATRRSSRPLRIAGIDFQVQGKGSQTRSELFAAALRPTSAEQAAQLAALDAAYVEKSVGPTEEKIKWVGANGRMLKELLDAAARVATGDIQWALQGASELMRRELARTEALARQEPIPAAFYEIRDEWMARSVDRLARANARPKVVAWMHNDHARYGEWEQGALRIKATGQFLREKFPGEVYSIGLLMGGGTFADNSRRERPVADLPDGSIERLFAAAKASQGFLRLSAATSDAVRRWADAEHPYVRGGTVAKMRPGREFDALLYFDKVWPPSFKLASQ